MNLRITFFVVLVIYLLPFLGCSRNSANFHQLVYPHKLNSLNLQAVNYIEQGLGGTLLVFIFNTGQDDLQLLVEHNEMQLVQDATAIDVLETILPDYEKIIKVQPRYFSAAKVYYVHKEGTTEQKYLICNEDSIHKNCYFIYSRV